MAKLKQQKRKRNPIPVDNISDSEYPETDHENDTFTKTREKRKKRRKLDSTSDSESESESGISSESSSSSESDSDSESGSSSGSGHVKAVRRSKRLKQFKFNDCYATDATDDEDMNYDPDESENTDAGFIVGDQHGNGGGFLATLLAKAANEARELDPDADSELKKQRKKRIVGKWCIGAEQGKIRKTKLIANKVYDKINAIPRRADILASKIPFKEKCYIMERMEILDNLAPGTEEYYHCKTDIFKRLASYDRIDDLDHALIATVHDEIGRMPTRTEILKSKMPIVDKVDLMERMERMDQYPSGSEEFQNARKSILRVLKSYSDMRETKEQIEQLQRTTQMHNQISSDPMKVKILKANITENNRMRILEMYEAMTHLAPWSEERSKKSEWIKWALCVTENMVPIPVQISDGSQAVSNYLCNVKHVLDQNLYGMEAVKENLIEIFGSYISNPNAKESALGIVGPPGVGKCLDPDTEILLYNGGVKLAKHIKKGDVLIGDDSEPRTVLSTTTGIDEMFELNLVAGESFRVNAPHVLTLIDPSKENNKAYDMPLDKFLAKSKKWQSKQSMIFPQIKYQEQKVPELPILKGIKCAKLKHISTEYLYNSRQVRFQLLKGIVKEYQKQAIAAQSNSLIAHNDSISLYVPQTQNVSLEIHDEAFCKQVRFLARSIGYAVHWNFPFLTIYGSINHLPQFMHRSISPFTVKKLGKGNYCGFTLDGNGRFVLGNGVITHNTHLIQSLSKAVQLPFKKINMGGKVDPHHFLGHNYTYIGSQPGVIVKALKKLKGKRGIIYFDEFDKIDAMANNNSKAGLVSQTFLHISDPLQQDDFQDEYLGDIKIDLSNIIFIYSFNDEEMINPILRNRIPIIKMKRYEQSEKIIIARQYMLPALLKNEGLATENITFTNNAYKWIINEVKRYDKDGLRAIRQTMGKVIKKINTLVMTARATVDNRLKLSYTIKNPKYPIKITVDILNSLNIKAPNDFDTYVRDRMYM